MTPLVLGVLITCMSPHTVDGDTIRCSNTPPVRLLAIDTPDKTWSYPCVKHIGNHICDDALAEQAAQVMREKLVGHVTLRPLKYDLYKRVVADVFVNRHDLSCYMMATKQARYIKSYEYKGIIIKRCPRTVRRAVHG